jgi:O-antigen/teichoic acid export membrane protein
MGVGSAAPSEGVAAGEAVGAPGGERPAVRERIRMQLEAAWAMPSMRAAAISGMQFGLTQGLRLGANLIMARLLFPEAFGVMAVVAMFMTALAMFSDVGLGPSIIQHRRGVEAGFANTAWTMQVVRGFVLWGAAALLGWPAAWFFQMPELVYLLPLVGVTAAISGFDSTAFHSLRRQLKLGRIVVVEVGAQGVGIAVTIALGLAYFYWAYGTLRFWGPHPAPPTPRAEFLGILVLAAGNIVAPILRMTGSHLMDRRVRNRFHWEAEAAGAIFHFGKWIFISTFLTFFAGQMDRVLVGKLIGKAALGVYSIGQNLATMLPQALHFLAASVVFPLLARVARERPHELASQSRRVRRAVLLPSSFALGLFVISGQWIVGVLYDSRYQDAGWVLQILAGGAMGMLISVLYGSALLGLGRSRETVIILTGQIAFLLAGSFIGYWLAGELWSGPGPAPDRVRMLGLVLGFGLTEWLNYPLVRWRARRQGLATTDLDLLAFGIVGGSALIALATH